MLGVLTARAGQVITKDELFQAVWPETTVSDAALSSCILELRHALRDDARRPRYIETLRRRGLRYSPSRFFAVLWGLWVFYLTRGPLSTAREFADRLLGLAQEEEDLRQLLEAHHAVGCTAFMLGALGTAQVHAGRGMALCGANRDVGLATTYGCTIHDAHLTNHHAVICGGLFSAWVDVLTGRSGTALRGVDAAVAHARDLAHPYTLALSLVLAAAALPVSRCAGAARELAAEAATIAHEHDFRTLRA